MHCGSFPEATQLRGWRLSNFHPEQFEWNKKEEFHRVGCTAVPHSPVLAVSGAGVCKMLGIVLLCTVKPDDTRN